MQIEEKIKSLLDQMSELDDELQALFRERKAQLQYEIKGRRIAFEESARAMHKRLKTGLFVWLRESELRNVLSAPFIYAMIFPFLLLDVTISIYQAACFRLYKIPRVKRSNYIFIDRHELAYLNAIEKFNCIYCGYANGLFAYAREIAACTEQYWCPIKHARKILDRHSRYAKFVDYGDPSEYPERLEQFRRELVPVRQENEER